MAAGAAAIPAAIAACGTPGNGKTPAGSTKNASASKRLVRENDLPGDRHWGIKHIGAQDAMMGYTGQASVLPGEPITLYASTTARSFSVKAFRMGWYKGDLARLLWQSGTLPGKRQRPYTMVESTRTIQTDWDISVTIPTHDWPEGSYLLRMDSDHGQRFAPVTIRSADCRGKTVIKNGTATWQAYNSWGGYNLYNGPGGPANYNNRSYAVSLDRPYDANGAYMFLWHERKFIALAERQPGLDLAYVSSMDIEAYPDLLKGASSLFSLGHDEYWSPPERAHVTAARNAGTNLGFLGANCCFRRTRLAPTRLGDRRLVICYKTSYMQDPEYGKNNKLVTSDWREPPDPDPESSMIGTLYESWPVDADYVVATPDAWMFHGTGVQKGTRLPGLVGIEYDRVNPDSPIERPIQIVSHSPVTCQGINSYSDSAYYTHKSGAGVFNAGTMRWVASMSGLGHEFGLTARTAAFTRHVSRNIVHAFAHGPAAEKFPAHDNLAAMQEWAGDPIASQHNLWPPIVL